MARYLNGKKGNGLASVEMQNSTSYTDTTRETGLPFLYKHNGRDITLDLSLLVKRHYTLPWLFQPASLYCVSVLLVNVNNRLHLVADVDQCARMGNSYASLCKTLYTNAGIGACPEQIYVLCTVVKTKARDCRQLMHNIKQLDAYNAVVSQVEAYVPAAIRYAGATNSMLAITSIICENLGHVRRRPLSVASIALCGYNGDFCKPDVNRIVRTTGKADFVFEVLV